MTTEQKNTAAASLARHKWSRIPAADRKAELSRVAGSITKKAAKARALKAAKTRRRRVLEKFRKENGFDE